MHKGALALMIVPFLLATGVAIPAYAIAGGTDGGRYTDREVLSGVIFGDGPVAEVIGTVVAMPDSVTPAMADEYMEVKTTLLDDLLTTPSLETAEAVSELRSGNPYKVEAGMATVSTAFSESLLINYPEMTSKSDIVSPQVCGPTVCAAAVIVAVAAVTAIALVNFNVAGSVNMIYNQNGLWTTNGVWISGSSTTQSTEPQSSLPSNDPTELVDAYPSLAQTEVVKQITNQLAD